jgi:uncharacterized Zn finger protein (UPF0148 family)
MEAPDREPSEPYGWAEDGPGEWAEDACPRCGAEGLDAHLHGGVSCPTCGWEGEWEAGRLVTAVPPVTPEEADAAWPDTFPGEWRASRRVARLAGFYHWSADIHELAERQREQLMTEAGKAITDYPYLLDEFTKLLDGIPDQGVKIMPWAAREFKRLWKRMKAVEWEIKEAHGEGVPETGPPPEAAQKIHDLWAEMNRLQYEFGRLPALAERASKWAEYARTYNIPLPPLNDKGFDSDAMERWSDQMENKEAEDPRTWKDSVPVHRFEDGWYVARVGAEDLKKEGRIMQHCVGGTTYWHQVENGELMIFSLREPGGQPHVTLSLQEPPVEWSGGTVTGWARSERDDPRLYFPEVYGKQDERPQPEYQKYIDEWFGHLRDLGWDPEEGEGEYAEPEDVWEEHWEGPFFVDDLEDLAVLSDEAANDREGWLHGEDQEPDLGDDNTFTYYNPRALRSSHGEVGQPEPYVALLRQFFALPEGERTADAGAEVVRDLWNMAFVATDQQGGMAWNTGNRVWDDEAAPALAGELERRVRRPVRGRPAPQAEGLFDPSGYAAQPAADPVAQHMLDYVRQLQGLGGQWQTTRTVAQRPEGVSFYTPPGVSYEEHTRDWPRVEQTNTHYLNLAGGLGGENPNGNFWARPEAQAPALPAPVFSRTAGAAGVARRAWEALVSGGGFTLRPDGREPGPGYYVAEDHTRLAPVKSVTPLDVRKYIDGVRELARDPALLVGGWVSGHGEAYLETSRSFDSLAEALEHARSRGEEAVWDAYLGREVRVADPLLEQ